MKLIGDLFKDKDEYYTFIVEETWDRLVYPNKVKYCVFDDMEECVRKSLIKDGKPEDITDATLAMFSIINEQGLKEIQEGKSKCFDANHIAMLNIYTNRLEKEINFGSYDGINPKDILRLTLYHECRHAQQFFYVLENFNDGASMYDYLVNTDYKLHDYSYMDCVLEADAEAYAYKYAINKNIKTPAGSLKLNKVISHLMTEIINTHWQVI